MKIIDNNGRLFGKISVIDVIVVAVVAALALALNLKTNTMTHTSTAIQNDTITYQLYVRSVGDFLTDDVQVGDKLFDEDRLNSGCLGEITAIEVLPGARQEQLDDGSVEFVPMEGAVDMILTVKGEGLISGKSYSLNRVYDLGVNSARNFCSQYARFTATVYSIG